MEKKRLFGTLGAIALTAAITAAGTFAYLNQVTETKQNIFNSDRDLKTKLEEDFDTETAKKYTPGDVIYKVPTISNEKESSNDVYVAVRLDYIDNSGNAVDKATFESKYAKIQHMISEKEYADGLNQGWKKIANLDNNGNVTSELYLFEKSLAPGESTNPAIFDATKVLTGIEEVIDTAKYTQTLFQEQEDGTYKEVSSESYVNKNKKFYEKDGEGNYVEVKGDVTKLPSFEIKVTGYAIQASTFADAAGAAGELMNLANGNLLPGIAGSFVAVQ